MVGVKKDRRRQRALRGTAAAVAATFLALTSHILGGGSMPTLMGIVAPLALSLLVCVLLAGRRMTLARLVPSVFVSQGLFHGLFSVFTPMHPMAMGATAVERQAMDHAGMDGSGAMAGQMAASAGQMSQMHSHFSVPMTIMHCVAAIATIALIYWAETLPVRLLAFVRLVVRALVPALGTVRALPERPRLAVPVCDFVPPPLGVLRSPVLRRGPPLPAF
ncbi:hypothetical protein GCM10009700_07970 [Brevibacterium sanguinis]|uniref:hypothetical protein n=1 Tax=Brevibacterium sanguinis TaxID=232444 RepID=UPI0031DD61B7